MKIKKSTIRKGLEGLGFFTAGFYTIKFIFGFSQLIELIYGWKYINQTPEQIFELTKLNTMLNMIFLLIFLILSIWSVCGEYNKALKKVFEEKEDKK